MDFEYENNRFFKTDSSGKLLAEITFPAAADGTWTIDHTFVDDSLRGQGIAGKLMDAVIGLAKKEHKKLMPTCTYAQSWFEKHPEEHSLLKKEQD